MKKLMMLALLLIVGGNAFAMGSKPKDPTTQYYNELFKITPACNSEFGKLSQLSQITEPEKWQAWADCYNCKRETLTKKYVAQLPDLQSDIDKYGALCPN